MSYDLRLIKPKPGEDPLVTAESESEEIGTTPPDPTKEAAKRRVADGLIDKNPKLRVFQFDYGKVAEFKKITVDEAKLRFRHLELNGPEEGCNGIQITLFDDEASVTVPYWYTLERATETFREIWDYLEIMTRETGYDPQVGRILDLASDFEEVVSAYSGTVGQVQKKFGVTERKPQKPWWQFW